jgi:phosphoribosylanthranilate isomerase
LQLHGTESPDYVKSVSDAFGLPIIKAISVCNADDVKKADDFHDIADMILFDAKPDPSASFAGGHGHSFDWSLLAEFRRQKPWFLAGGLMVENVETAITTTKARLVDVSSGVEKAKGKKDPTLIKAFTTAAAQAFSVRRVCSGVQETSCTPRPL